MMKPQLAFTVIVQLAHVLQLEPVDRTVLEGTVSLLQRTTLRYLGEDCPLIIPSQLKHNEQEGKCRDSRRRPILLRLW